jgi:hypothetical protein
MLEKWEANRKVHVKRVVKTRFVKQQSLEVTLINIKKNKPKQW